MIGLFSRPPYPQSGVTYREERAEITLLSKEFRSLKKRHASEIEFATWRTNVRERFGIRAGRLLEKVREHVQIIEKL